MKKFYLLCLLVMLPLVASADAVQIGAIYYNLNAENQTAEVTNNPNKYSGDIVIPESVTYEEVTYSVTSIGYAAFQDCSGLTSITIPNGVTSIGGSAFDKCSGLISVVIPNSVSSIGNYAFTDCSSMTSIAVEAGNTKFDSRDNCNAIIETASNTLKAGCKTTVIPTNVTTIGFAAFDGCSGLTSVTIPNSVTSIKDVAFCDCSSLTSITIPNSVTSIGSSTFAGCGNLTSIVVEAGNTVYDSRDNCNALIETASNTLMRGCEKTVIPNSVTTIGRNAFSYCTGLSSVTIPNSVTSIGKYAFTKCKAMTSLTIPNSVTSIDNSAFFDCWGLTSVTSLATTPPQAVDNSFNNYKIPLYVPKGTRDAYLAQEPWNKFKEIVELGNTSDDTDVDEITIKDIGKTTWCSEYDLDFTNVAGIKAYTATGYDNIDKTIWLTRVMKVPAGTGLLVKGDPGTYKIPHAEVQAYYVNMLVGNLGDAIKIAETDGDKTNYYLSGKDGTFVSVNGNANIGKNKAYLQLPTSVFAGTRSIGISYDDEDGTTGVKEVKSGEVKGEKWFTLQGQRVAKPGKGLYIKNGKVVVIK